MARHVSFALRRRIYLFSERYYWFMHSPWAGGVMLVIFMLLALLLGNLPATKECYYGILHRNFTIGFDGFALSKSIEHWINDGLMVIFFFYVGLEIKREIIAGELSSPRKAAMPIAAAIGGIRPLSICCSTQAERPPQAGESRWLPILPLPLAYCRFWEIESRCH